MSSDRKSKVLFIGPYPPPFSGPEMGMKLFLDSSMKDDFNISFLCTNVRKSNVNKGKFGMPMAMAFVRFFSLLLWKLISHRPRVIYYPITATEIGWIGRDAPCLFLCRLFGARPIIHLRASHFRLNFDQFSPTTKWLIRRALKCVCIAIVQSDQLHNQFEALVAPDRIRTLYQAIESDQYVNENLGDYQAGKILFLGHMTQAKGYCDLVRAIEPVVATCQKAQFHFAGTMRRGERNVFFNQITGERLRYEDPFEVEKEVLASSSADHYHNLGVIHGDEKLWQLRSADIFVLPSYSEGFSRAIVEALCVGKPVIYTPVGAHREALNEGVGACIKPGDQQQLADALISLLKDRERRDEIAKRNYQFARESFDIEIIAGRFSKIIRELVEL